MPAPAWPVLAMLVGLLLWPLAPVLAATVGAVGQEVPLVGLEAARSSYSLAGEWRFQPGDDPARALPHYDDSNWSNSPVPGRWPRGGYPQAGQFGWYRLTVKFDLPDAAARRQLGRLGLRMGKVLSAYELYAGGQLLGGVGRLPPWRSGAAALSRVSSAWVIIAACCRPRLWDSYRNC